MSAIRLGKGTLNTNFEQLYTVPDDRLVILKSIVISNSTEMEQTVDLKLAGIDVIIGKVIEAGKSYRVSTFDQVILAHETIEGKASSVGVNYYISGKLLLPQDITSETQWMQEQWDAWWAAHPEEYEGVWHDWIAAKTNEPDGAFYAEWKAWFDELQDTTNLVTKSQFDAHKTDIMNIDGKHGIRFWDGKLELKIDGEWTEFYSGSRYPVGNVLSFNARSDDKRVMLTWRDPENVTVIDTNNNEVIVAKWKGTKILRKETPDFAHENDGVLVVDSGIRDQYAETGFEDTGLTNDKTYYYMAFPYTEDGIFTIDELNKISATPTEIKIYGVRIDKNNSNPNTRVEYIGDSMNFTPIRGNNGSLQWGSWEGICEKLEITPCVLKNKQVQYYLDPDDYTQKAGNGGSATLTGADGDVMIEFGKTIWSKWTDEGTTYTIEISDKEFDDAVKYAFEIEDGYNLVPYYPLLLTQHIYIILFKSTDAQTALGRGWVDSPTNPDYANTGNTNTKGMFFGETTGQQQMKFLGIEDFWGNKFWWIDGLVTDDNYEILIGKNNFNDTGNGYTSYPSDISANTSGYIKKVQGGNEKGFIIKEKDGAENQYYCDSGYLDSGRVARFGGDRNYGSDAGFAYLYLADAAGHAPAYVGARLFCASGGKIYIGAYLGYTEDSKLRSISGKEPTGNKTIGVFRTEARANN